MLGEQCYAVIMAGGAGTRLWPLSNRSMPKHFLKLFDGKSLIELTVDRLEGLVPSERILILTSIDYQAIARATLPQIPSENFIYEPCLRDTASALGLAATILSIRCPTSTMIVQTADQLIEPVDRFAEAVTGAAGFLEAYPDQLVAFGVDAASPSTLVGWQKLGDTLDFPDCQVRRIAAFTEKPDLETAQRFMAEGGYCWNSGQFAWKAKALLKEMNSHLPETTPLLSQIGDAWHTAERDRVLNQVYPQMPKGSIDYRVMQKTRHACSIRLPCHWDDMGTHAALANRVGKRRDGNAIVGDASILGTNNIVLSNTDQRIVVAQDNLVIVVTRDTVFVGDRSTDMKGLVEKVLGNTTTGAVD